MEFVDKKQLEIKAKKIDRSVFLYTIIVLPICFIAFIITLFLAYSPIKFNYDVQNEHVTVERIGFYLAYTENFRKPTDFQFGWLNVTMIVVCVIQFILLVILFYLNFFLCKRTVMNRYGYVACLTIVLGFIFANITGHLSGRVDPYNIDDNFFPNFFIVDNIDSNVWTFTWGPGIIALFCFNVLFGLTTLTMIIFWLIWANKTGRITKNTGHIILMIEERKQEKIKAKALKNHKHKQ